MKQETYLQPDYSTPDEFKTVTIIDTACPACRAHIRFVPPDGNELISYREQSDFFRRECERLRYELRKMELLMKNASFKGLT